MATETPAETPARKVMRQWFQGKLAERLAHSANMSLDRELLRRGARKQQDGTLGQPSQSADTAETAGVNIRVGDDIHYHTESARQAPADSTKTLTQKLLPYALVAASALGAGGLGSGLTAWLLQEPPAAEDTDTTRRIEIEKWVPE